MATNSKSANQNFEQQRQRNQSLYSKYLNLGKEFLSQGDRVESERNFQMAEHYARLLGQNGESFHEKKQSTLVAESHSSSEIQNFPIENSEDASPPIQPRDGRSGPGARRKNGIFGQRKNAKKREEEE
jgi:hypothetical protein